MMDKVKNNEPMQHARQSMDVLLVTATPDCWHEILKALARKGISVTIAKNKKSALQYLDHNVYGLIFTAKNISAKNDGFDLLHTIRRNIPELPMVLLIEPENDVSAKPQFIAEATLFAAQNGFHDVLIPPLEKNRIDALLDTYFVRKFSPSVAAYNNDTAAKYMIVGRSPQLMQTIELAKRIALTNAPVLISGESGTGKELFSRLIHSHSRRNTGPFIQVNCAALNESLLESELFGHEKGSFTGAYQQRKGRFEMAHGGTLLLDEITEIPLHVQSKLLRAIEQQDFERVGGNDNIQVNVRIISTTNRKLTQEVSNGRFRLDLYYRLSGLRLPIPSLSKRTADLEDMVWHFVNLHAPQIPRKITQLDPVMMELFANYHWPGNIRQLRNVVLTSLVLGNGEKLELADVSWLFDEITTVNQSDQNTDLRSDLLQNEKYDSDSLDLGDMPLEEIEQQAILSTLRRTAGNQTKAAKVLGISDRTLRDRLKRYREQGILEPVYAK